ncbi:hypothetical protein FA822_18545 [Escherichia coli]|uniref:hypothetical protein n=1 Tax=Escherichia coli TaxID=562 RepID=UPI0018492F40|nr:hypothetical protein [Escherichia coli]EFC1641691.1 hypothetical protein [Escherichia coli]EFD4961528.1 hypothetical protein [Escherichia coli]HAW3707833.1 hypothetical protein [Escherichia coli]
MLSRVFPCLSLNNKASHLPEISGPVLLSTTITTDGYSVFNKKMNQHELQITTGHRTGSLKFTATEMQWLAKINESATRSQQKEYPAFI